jgi:hypothetical protein
MQGGRARAASMTAEERSAWARYMFKHQPRFWDGTLPRKPVRARRPVSVGASPVGELAAVSAPARKPAPPPIPVVVMPRRAAVVPVVRPGMRYDV